MTHHVLVPWRDIADAAASRPRPWPSLAVDVYDGDGGPPAHLSDVEFYVVPYDKGADSRELVTRMPSLRVVQSLNAGVDDLLPLVPTDVVLCNGKGLHDASTAEHALALILAALRELPRFLAAQARSRWDHDHTRSLADSRVTVLGYGAIGAALGDRLRACEALVTPVARRARPDEGVRGAGELPGLLADTDVLVLVLPDTPATVGFVGAGMLAALPDGALVVNVGRGRTLDTAALLSETASGRLSAALDVVDPEPLPPDHPLWTTSGVLITPHVAGGAASFHPRAKRLVTDQLRRFDAGEPQLNIVEREAAS